MGRRRVLVTGVGLVTPLGSNAFDVWNKLKEGASGINLLDCFNVSAFNVRIGGQIKDFDATPYIPGKDRKRVADFIQYGVAAGCQAIQDAGFDITDDNADRVGISIGSGIGGIKGIENSTKKILDKGPRGISPFYIPFSLINMIPSYLSIQCGARGPNLALVTACSAGTHNIGQAMRLIEYGDADAVIAGASEASISPTCLSGFDALRGLSSRNDDPQAASRPWDRDRDGFVVSEGAGAVLLEEYGHAKSRGADVYAELIGYASNSDAYHITSPLENGGGAMKCMEKALINANTNTEQVDYINAHATSTKAGDLAEVMAIKRLFGDCAKDLAISSCKSMLGHTLGAAGAIEAVISVLTLRDQVVTPTINLDNPDIGCDLDFVPHEARSVNADIVLSNSFGFGGTNGSLVFKRF